MINKKLLSFDRGALRFVGANVAFQWLGMLCNVVFVRTIAVLLGAVFAGSLTGALLTRSLVVCLCTVPLRFGFVVCDAAAVRCTNCTGLPRPPLLGEVSSGKRDGEVVRRAA